MTTKEKETDKDAIEEKRIKPSVIRRRSRPPAPAVKAKSEPAELSEQPEEVKEPARAEKPMRAEKAEKAEEPGKAEKEATKPSRKTAAKETKKGEKEKKPRTRGTQREVLEAAAEERPAAEAKAVPEEKPSEKTVVKEKKPAAKREVKVFEKEPELKKFYTGRRPPKKSKRFQPRQAQRKAQLTQTRPLKKTEITVPKAAKRVVKVAEAISVGDLSQRLGVKANELIKKLMGLGIMATVNQLVDIDSATLIAQEYGYGVENVSVQEETLIDTGAEPQEGKAEHRAPVVTVMGHMDHGKTSLLDAIRKTNVVSDEAGGITQHIGAYHVHLDKGDITFLDTPGHEAFTQMRSRGAKVTDIVVLVVAADDGVMPQTVEAINHAKAAGVPIIVAVNKIDLPQADPSRVKNELAKYELVPEDWGGQTIFVEVSAKKVTNIKGLLEMILLQAEMLELKAASDVPARGIIIESKLDKGRGPVSTVLIQSGKLKVGDAFVTGVHHGRIRAMINDWGQRATEAGPSMPIEILGLSGVPQAGDSFIVVKDEATARQIASIRERKNMEVERMKTAKVSLADLYERISKGEVKELNIIIKADVQGSIEAVAESLDKLSTDAVKIKAIHSAVGGISEGDVMLAAASDAIIIGFNVRPEPKAQTLAEKESVDVRLYNVIYNLVDDIKKAMEGLLEPIVREEVIGRAEIRDVFKVSKVGTVAGCYVTDGKAERGARVRLIRDNVVIYEGKLSSLKRFKEDAKEVASGYECGMAIEGYNDIKVGDVIELYVEKQEAARL